MSGLQEALDQIPGVANPQLLEWLEGVEKTVEEGKALLKALNEEVEKRFGEALKQRRAEEGKDTGTVVHSIGPGIAAESVVTKKVDWDSDKLFEASKSLSWDKVRTIFKFKLSIPEATYKAFAAIDLPEETRAAIEGARTTKYSEKIALVRVEKEGA